MAANDDEFISNIALTESVKNCSILRHIRIEEYKDIEKKKRNGRTGTEVGLFGVSAGIGCVGLYTCSTSDYTVSKKTKHPTLAHNFTKY